MTLNSAKLQSLEQAKIPQELRAQKRPEYGEQRQPLARPGLQFQEARKREQQPGQAQRMHTFSNHSLFDDMDTAKEMQYEAQSYIARQLQREYEYEEPEDRSVTSHRSRRSQSSEHHANMLSNIPPSISVPITTYYCNAAVQTSLLYSEATVSNPFSVPELWNCLVRMLNDCGATGLFAGLRFYNMM